MAALKINQERKREAIQAQENRRELIAAKFSRRDLIRMGLLPSAGYLVPTNVTLLT